jgi:hypothetical protein
MDSIKRNNQADVLESFVQVVNSAVDAKIQDLVTFRDEQHEEAENRIMHLSLQIQDPADDRARKYEDLKGKIGLKYARIGEEFNSAFASLESGTIKRMKEVLGTEKDYEDKLEEIWMAFEDQSMDLDQKYTGILCEMTHKIKSKADDIFMGSPLEKSREKEWNAKSKGGFLDRKETLQREMSF